jgi:hypothetical protein
MRIGFFDVVTASVEGMYAPSGYSNSSASYIEFTIGAGLSSPAFRLYLFECFIHLHYMETLYIDRSSAKDDQRFKDFLISVPVKFNFKFFSQQGAVWTAPVYSRNELYLIQEDDRQIRVDNFGYALGVEALFIKHIYLNTNILYSNYFQFRFIIGYRF